MLQRYGLILLGLATGIMFWPLEALMHAFVFDKGDFISNLFSSDPDEIWMRALITMAFVGFGWLSQRSLHQQLELKARLQRKRDHLGRVIDSTYDAYVAINEEGIVVGWNSSAEKMFGHLRQNAIGKDLATLMIPERLRMSHHKGLQRYRERGTGTMLYRPVQMWACHRDGSEFEISMVITPLRVEEGYEFFSFIRRMDEAVQQGQRGL